MKSGLDRCANAAAAGFADASISKSLNAIGNPVEDSSLDTKSKKALGSALSKSAERFAEKTRGAAEHSVLRGPVMIRVLVLERAKKRSDLDQI